MLQREERSVASKGLGRAPKAVGRGLQVSARPAALALCVALCIGSLTVQTVSLRRWDVALESDPLSGSDRNATSDEGTAAGVLPPGNLAATATAAENATLFTRFVPMATNNHSDALCAAEVYSSDAHVKNMGIMFAFLESYGHPYWHNRGLARIATRFGAGLIEVKPGFVIGPDHDFDLMVLVDDERQFNATIHDMVERCPPELFCVVQVQWNIPRLYIWKIGLPVKYANLMPLYHRNATHGQYHPFHKQKVGSWTLLDDLFPLEKAKLWMYELPVSRESSHCEDGLNTTRIFAKHNLTTAEEQRRARGLMYGCAKNLTAEGFASYFHCFDERGSYNGSSWKP